MKTSIRIFLALALVALIAVANVSVALADDGKDDSDTKQSEGIVPPKLGPNARQEIFQSGGGGKDIGRFGFATPYEDWEVHGWHCSISDMTEDIVWVIGGIQIVGQSWYDIQGDYQENYFYALTVTSMPDPAGDQTFHTQSEHYFHTDGYEDSHGYSHGWIIT